MDTASLNKQFYSFLWAYILVALSGCLGTVVDGIIVGNLISEDGVSAINLSRPCVQFFFTLHMLVNGGGGMLVGYALGQKDVNESRRLFTRALTLSMGIGFLFAIVCGLIYIDASARLLCSNEQLLPMARDYLQVMLLGIPAYILMWALSTFVGVDGSPKLVSVAVIIDNAVNLMLDIVFIQWLGWGIIGSSAATVVGHLVGIAIILFFWLRSEKRQLALKYMLNGILPDWRRIVSQGAPLAIASICLTLLLLSANTIVLSSMGRTGIFAFAICMNLLQIYNLFLAGSCQTLQSLGAIQVGKCDNEGLMLVLRKTFWFITISMAVTCIFVWIDPQIISRIFGATDPDMLAETNHALRIFALSFIPFCYIYILMIVYKLYGYDRMALFISFALSLTVIPVLWIVSNVAPDLLWYSYLIAYVIESIAILLLHTGYKVQFKLKTISK